ncbi:hypothetical protein SteCoe_32201 [Stentor coeruleus]|uniref:Uncharacterized protein n=1 Tax=Stentor coeruleus TaxID=5963 RepID=A0A1R2AZK2_9CILI|nr:hypothetical protein SteCoe_32201 [Stentor coeruleus]
MELQFVCFSCQNKADYKCSLCKQQFCSHHAEKPSEVLSGNLSNLIENLSKYIGILNQPESLNIEDLRKTLSNSVEEFKKYEQLYKANEKQIVKYKEYIKELNQNNKSQYEMIENLKKELENWKINDHEMKEKYYELIKGNKNINSSLEIYKKKFDKLKLEHSIVLDNLYKKLKDSENEIINYKKKMQEDAREIKKYEDLIQKIIHMLETNEKNTKIYDKLVASKVLSKKEKPNSLSKKKSYKMDIENKEKIEECFKKKLKNSDHSEKIFFNHENSLDKSNTKENKEENFNSLPTKIINPFSGWPDEYTEKNESKDKSEIEKNSTFINDLGIGAIESYSSDFRESIYISSNKEIIKGLHGENDSCFYDDIKESNITLSNRSFIKNSKYTFSTSNTITENRLFTKNSKYTFSTSDAITKNIQTL